MYWDENQTPLIKAIIKNNRKVLKNWDVRILSKKTIHTYIKKFPKEYDSITVQQQSDWIRLYLIMTYGGIWSDASIIYNDVSKVEELWKKSIHYDYIGFFNNHKKVKNVYTNIETWFFGSEKNGEIVTLWYNEYTNAMKEGFLTYRNRILQEGTKLDEYYKDKVNDDVYFIVYMCLQHVLQHKNKIPPMLLLHAYKSMFLLHEHCKNKTINYCVMNKIKTRKYVKKIPFIKLTRHERNTNINILHYFQD
jgi:hypothetical protein